jgi:Rod binding domain-containing protein
LGNNNESKIIKAMFNENLAQEISRGGGMGLGNMLFESLKDST